MHNLNDLDPWRQRHEELIREAENGRLAWRRRAQRPKKVSRLKGGPIESVRAHLPRRKGAAEC